MVLRVARRGRNAGNEFWGCSTFPKCKGTRDRDESATSQELPSTGVGEAPGPFSRFRPRVDWVDPSSARDWDTLFVIGGGGLRSTSYVTDSLEKLYPAALRRLEQTFIAVSPPDLRSGIEPQVGQVVGTFRKILQRGDAPPHEPEVEQALLRLVGVHEMVESGDPGEGAFEVVPHSIPVTEEEVVAAGLSSALDFQPRDAIQYDSYEERAFGEWVAEEFGGGVTRWLYPQAPYAALLGDTTDRRRADFVLAPPWRTPLIIEIDGEQHESQVEVDQQREGQLLKAGFEVHRITAQQVRGKESGALPDLTPPTTPEPSSPAQLLVHGPAQITRLGLAIAEAVERGFLPEGDSWSLTIEDDLRVSEWALKPLVELFAAVDELWAGWVAPSEVRVSTAEGTFALHRRSQTHYQQRPFHDDVEPQVVIRLEHDRAPQDTLEGSITPTIVMRPATLPVSLADRRAEGSSMAVARDPQSMEEPLHRILTYVFAKREFREGQLKAISQTLQGKDCLVLLPTGAGKSLVYQMAGLLLPGRTLIIDPIVALMEDQVEGLRRFGIDRAVAMSSFTTQQGLADQALDQVRNGDGLFFFISPERLQTQTFRDSLQGLTATTPVNLVVVDEAHCISEWGHDFRPAYLNMGPLIRRLARSALGQAPPILALTGTASRAVLRDVLIELDLDRSDPDGVVKPESFDRAELSYEVVKASPGETRARLVGAIKSIPQYLGDRPGRFFDRVARPANLGIVFCPFVNGEFGVVNVARELAGAITPHIEYYSGSAPRGLNDRAWQIQKRETALAFRDGEIVLLCATKAFGMGVDIPNVRYTVHLGIPASIEAFYQEAGRAGRDRRASRCVIVFTERNARLNERLLSDSTEGDEARAIYEDQGRGEDDDIRRQLFFFFNTFQGRDRETQAVVDLLDQLDWSGTAKTIDVPFSDEVDLRERAILRLIQVGAVGDYLKDWGPKKFQVFLTEATSEDLDESFLSFVARTQPGRVEERRQALATLPTSPPDRARDLAGMAVDLVYDSVEKSRRRALREMRLLAAAGASDAEIRRRIEDYFREGDIAPQLEQLTESTSVDLDEWKQAFSDLTVADEGELRGSTARLLESYPDHPGLLLGRAIAELMSGESQFEFSDNIGRALQFGAERYSMSQADLARLAATALDAASLHRPSWRPIVWDRVLPYLEDDDPWEFLIAANDDTRLVDGERVMHMQTRLHAGLNAARDLLAHHHGNGGLDE